MTIPGADSTLNHDLWRRLLSPTSIVSLALFTTACGQSSLKMEPGVPIVRKPGYCFLRTAYAQNGQVRNRSDTLEQLAKYSEIRGHVSAGNTLGLTSDITGAVAGPLLGLGIVGATGGLNMDRSASTALLASAAALTVVATATCIVSEGQYATAVDIYNTRIVPRGGAQDVDTETSSGSKDPDPYDDEGRTKTPVEGMKPPR